MSDSEVLDRLQRIEATLELLVARHSIQEWYDTTTVAAILDRSTYQVREWCRYGRVQAVKRAVGRGRSKEWMVSHDELMRIKSHGLLPKDGPDG